MIYAKLNEKGWPIEIRGDDWPERNWTFFDQEEYDLYCDENAELRPVVEETPPEPDWWWVTKDSIVSRIAACGDDAIVMLDSIIQAQPKVKQILWREFSVFRSDNQELRALAGALAPFGVDPDVVFAYDPLAPKR